MLLYIVRFFSKMIAKIHAPFSVKYVSGLDFDVISKCCLPGDILLSRTRGELGNLFIKGYWKHAAIVKDADTVVEAVTKGVVITHMFDFLRTKDSVALLRASIPEDVRKQIADEAISFVGCDYDFEFQKNDPEYYCSELVRTCYSNSGIPFGDEGIIYPSDIMGVKELCLIYRSREK